MQINVILSKISLFTISGRRDFAAKAVEGGLANENADKQYDDDYDDCLSRLLKENLFTDHQLVLNTKGTVRCRL